MTKAPSAPPSARPSPSAHPSPKQTCADLTLSRPQGHRRSQSHAGLPRLIWGRNEPWSAVPRPISRFGSPHKLLPLIHSVGLTRGADTTAFVLCNRSDAAHTLRGAPEGGAAGPLRRRLPRAVLAWLASSLADEEAVRVRLRGHVPRVC